MTDDGGVLGNLPNSRPGQRSSKRSGSGSQARSAADAAAKAEAAGERAATPPPPRTDTPSGAEAVAGVVRTAAGVATAGVRVAGAVTHELLRRLPRP